MDSNLSFIQEGKVYNIELGTTFQRRKEAAFHTVRYDFKPASVDLTQQGEVVVGETNEVGETNVSIALPHQQGLKNSSVVYKGSKKPAQKECVLIYDRETRSFTLERITSQIQVKKTRSSGNSGSQPPVLPSVGPAKMVKKPAKKINNSKNQKSLPVDTRKIETEGRNETMNQVLLPSVVPPSDDDQPPLKKRSLSASSSSDDNSSSSDSSSSDNDSSSSDESSVRSPAAALSTSQLDKDLELSDSSDDSD